MSHLNHFIIQLARLNYSAQTFQFEIINVFFHVALESKSGPDHHIIEVCRSHTDTYTHTRTHTRKDSE